MELIYRGTRDGSGCNIFHNKCNNQGPTLVLYKNDKGNILGGYTPISWTSDNNYHSAKESFLFTLTNIHNLAPTKFPNTDSRDSVHHSSNYFSIFGGGHDIIICNDFLNNSSGTNFPHSYEDILGKGKSIFTWNPNNGSSNIQIKELEVIKLNIVKE